MNTRRTFLRGLTTLPLIGGSVALIGKPTAAAVAITPDLLDAYSQWLFFERRLLCIERFGDTDQDKFVPMNTPADQFHFPHYPAHWQDLQQPSSRAAVVLSAVGCPLAHGRQP